MKNQLGWAALLIGLTCPALAEAQLNSPTPMAPPIDGRSHITIPSQADSATTAREYANERLGHARGTSGLQKLAEGLLKDPENLKMLLEGIDEKQLKEVQKDLPKWKSQIDPDDPKLQELVKNFIDKNPKPTEELTKKLNMSDQQVKDMKKVLDENKSSTTQTGNKSTDTGPKGSNDGPKGSPDKNSKDPTKTNEHPADDDSKVLKPEEQEKRVQAGNGVLKRLGKFLGMRGALPRNSHLGKSFMDLLTKSGAGQKKESRLLKLASTLGMDKALGRLGNDSLPGLSKLSLNLFSGSGKGSMGGGGGGGGSLDTPNASAAGPIFLWVALAFAACIIVWRLLVWRQRPTEDATASAWRLGPWPLHPGTVATRGQLIQAFEYLSVLLLGAEARHRNHRDIAVRLALRPALDPQDQRRAVDTLAALYELARYAPPEEPLAEQELTAARRDLCALAGMATS